MSLAASAFKRATCMTDSLAALACLASLPGPEKDEALQVGYGGLCVCMCVCLGLHGLYCRPVVRPFVCLAG